MPAPTLYYFPLSPPSRSVLLLVKELGLTLNLKEVNSMTGETRTEEFMRMNPEHCVPTLDDNGFYLWESRAILSYLVDAYRPGHDLYPNIPRDKAQINRVLYHDLGAFFPKFFGVIGKLFSGAVTELSEEMITGARNALTDLETYLIRNDYFAGEKITIADLALLPTVCSAVHCGLDLTKYQRLHGWYETCRKEVKGFAEDEAIAIQLGELFRSKAPAGLAALN